MTDERATVTIRRCLAEDVDDVLAFIDAHWKPGHIFTRHRGLFDWQHALHDRPGEYSIAIARRTADRTLLGILGYVPTRQFDSSIARQHRVARAVEGSRRCRTAPGSGSGCSRS